MVLTRVPGAGRRCALLSPLPAVIVECCAQLCPALGTGSTPGTAVPEHDQTDPERGAGTRRAPEAELLPFPSTAEPPKTQGSPQAGGEGTRPPVRDGAATEHLEPLLPEGSPEQAAAGGERPSPSPAPLEPGTAASAPVTDPVGSAVALGATTLPGTPSHSPSPTAAPAFAGGRRVSPSAPPGCSPAGTGLAQRLGGSHGPSTPEPGAGDGLGATVTVGDSGVGTRLSMALGTGRPGPGDTGTSPFVGGVQGLLSPGGTPGGTRRGLPELAGGSRLWHRTTVSWQGPLSAPQPSLPSLGAVGTGPALLPATGKGSGLSVPTATTGRPEVTSPGLGSALDPAMGASRPLDTEGPPEPSDVPLEQTWRPPAVPGQPPASVAVAQGRVPDTSSASPHVPLAPQPAPTSPTPWPSLASSWGVEGLIPTASAPPAGVTPQHRLPHAGQGDTPAESPQIPGGTPVWAGKAEPGAATAPLSWRLRSLAPSSAAGHPWHRPSPPAASLGLDTAGGVTNTIAAATITAATAATTTITAATATIAAATTATITTATTSPAPLGDVGTATPEPSAAVLQGAVAGLTWGPPTHLPTTVPGSPQQPPGTLGGPGSPLPAGDTGLAEQPSSPAGQVDAGTPGATPAAAGRAPRVFIAEDQPPLLRASILRIPCELVLDTVFTPALQDPKSRTRRALLHSFNRTVAPLFMAVPGFLRLEVTEIREGSVVLAYDALFVAQQVQALGLGALLDAVQGSVGAQPVLAVGAAAVLRHAVLERPLDPCAVLFVCRPGFACVSGAAGNATCTSLCHRDYCKNQGICTHAPERAPLCQCPVGSDFWFMGLRCDYRVTQQSLLGTAAGILLSIILLGAIATAVAVRRFKALLLEARADQTRSSYRRFCRLDDVSAQYWSRSRLPSSSSLDNPAFSNSEELLHLQILDNGCCGCREDSGITDGSKHRPALPARRPSFHYEWDTSSSSMNDPMVDSGKASDISVSSWPMEPIQWAPFPSLHQLSRQRPHRARRPRSYCEGMELGSLERSWTA
ncbi:nascent polypeptide-associated complex subunit alpha, muscle-specific form-like isoform X2 [Cuculus canorus]|uniref:nascent polypeptide-associated complex subunit alpha, muscle-specific form-like isoform X2 n=1 Tax=Cuculus canorus TaxID=55661 RepID=UPI0023AAC563|nr:nascent polypeptide-associated complex subunit alpha, muscle-specific form-like isoform X2 [Cuculus canorus]